MNLKKLSYLFKIIPIVLLLIAGTTKVKAQYLLNEGFEGTTFPPAGWTNFWAPNSATAYYPWQQIPTAYAYPSLPGPHSGSYAATMYNYGNYTYININGTYYYGLSTNELVTPALQLQNYTNGYALISLWIYRYGTNYTNFSNNLMNDDKLSIYVSTTPSVTNASSYLGVLSEYTTVGSYFSSSQSVSAAGWYQYSFSIPSSYNNAPAYVIFQDSSNYGFSVNIDDVSVKWIAPCTGMPLSSTITTNALPQPLCSGNTTTVAASDPNTAASLYTYWQSSPTGAPGSWSTIPGTFGPLNVSGGGTSSYTTPALTGSVYYRFADSCAVSGSVAYSSVYAVPVNLYSIPYAEYFNTTPNTQAPTCFTENVTSSMQSHWGTNIVFRDANGTAYPSVISEDDKKGNYQSGKNAFFTLPALALNAGETYRIRFGYERGRADYLTTNVAPVYPENLYLYENYAVQPPTSGTGIPGGGNAINLFNNVVTVDGHQTASLTFTPSVSGAYFFSWYSNTPHPAGGVLVDGGLIAVDSIKIDSFGCTPPNITFQPQNSAVCLNGTTSLSVNATGYGLTYQWYKNSSLITGATSSVLTIGNAQFADSGSYKVIVTGTCDHVQNIQSNTVSLKVSAYPTDT
ncbi:MAG: immunoglobulin domain-containing protein, partial [Flavipsychrobacter sp.]|nr:immunoglobulin domain-containing protein [Flavipsychrobacter sp.]